MEPIFVGDRMPDVIHCLDKTGSDAWVGPNDSAINVNQKSAHTL